MQSIAGKTAIVTGASSGIGRAIAIELARAGMVTFAAARSLDKLEALVGEIAGFGGKAVAVRTDVSDEAEVGALFAAVEAQAGPPALLVNNAGIADATAIDEISLARWREVLDANLTSAMLCSREAVRAMKRAGGGCIVNIGSLSAKSPRPNSPAYTASKFAIEGLTRSLALDCREFNITACALHPGQTRSSLVPGVTDRVLPDQIDPADIGQLVVLIASLPAGIALLDSTILPARVPFLGRG